MHFKVAVGEYLPFLKLSVLFGNVSMTGPLAEAFHELSLRLNFTYTLYKVKGNSWGTHGPNGWTGMLGMIERKEVDMAVGPFTLTYSRWMSFKLSAPLYVDNVEILVPPSQWKMTLFSAVSTFSASVWLALFFSVVSLSFLITVIDKFRLEDVKFPGKLFCNLWMLMKTLLQKGRREKPDDCIQSFLSAMWMFSALVVSSLFSGALLTRLFVRKVQRIDSVDDLVSASNMQPILESDSSIFGMFQKSQAEVYQTIFQRAISNPDKGILTFANMSSMGMDYVASGFSAMITDGMGLKGFMAHRLDEGLPCNYWLAQETVFAMWKVIAFDQNFSDKWLIKINKYLRHTLESGWLQKRMEREFFKYTECMTPNLNGQVILGLQHTKGIFLIWSLGCGISFLALFVEWFTVHRPQIFCNEKITKNSGTFLVGKSSRMYSQVGIVSKKNIHRQNRVFW